MMLGLVNIVRGCCHATTSSSRGWGAIGGVVILLVVLALVMRGVGPVAGALVDPASDLNRTVGALVGTLLAIAGGVVGLVVAGVVVWFVVDHARSVEARRRFAAHNAALDAAAAERRHAEQVATEHQPRQRVTSTVDDRREGTAPADEPEPVDEPAPVDLDDLGDLDELAARRARRWSA